MRLEWRDGGRIANLFDVDIDGGFCGRVRKTDSLWIAELPAIDKGVFAGADLTCACFTKEEAQAVLERWVKSGAFHTLRGLSDE